MSRIIKPDHIRAQNAARETMSELHRLIRPGMSEKQIESLALEGLVKRGSNSWWYHGVGALVLLGDRSRVSTSGREYYASDSNILGENDLVTLDLAPTIDGCWGDYARTIFFEDGRAAPEDQPGRPEFRDGLEAELQLHRRLMELLRPEMTYEEVYYMMNREIDQLGFLNLDYRKNLGHTVEVDEKDRVYIEKGSLSTFAELAKPFTFEPHIARPDGRVGFKRENIYYFEGGTLRCL